jgi:hypothetical protein
VRLKLLQQRLQDLYEVELEHNVDDFLITDRNLARRFVHAHPHQPREQLLILDEGEALGLALYLDPDVLERLRIGDPLASLSTRNLDDLCLAIEGVSHFLYLCWNAQHRRRVSLLELELQAEVDKFVTLSLLLAEQRAHAARARLHGVLFEEVTFAATLDREQRQRYRDANRYAARYCAQLKRRFGGMREGSGLFNELRRFYRLNQGGKLARINALH